ncbi:MAG: hypothetical protein IKZ87_04730 [Actinomycetaceae bacterium]|nr:hypothetical protein [Actinomycetaceae bacterium]
MKLDNINTSRALGIAVTVALCVIGAVHAQTQVQTQETRTQTGGTQAAATQNSWTRLTDHDRLLAQIWGLTEEEMERAKVLLQGPRRSFSVENLSPIEALGIHARTEAERRKYAEMFARAFHQDVERSLAWQRAYTDAMNRLYPNEPVIKWDGVKVKAHPGAAALGHIPYSELIDEDEPASEPPAKAAPASAAGVVGTAAAAAAAALKSLGEK